MKRALIVITAIAAANLAAWILLIFASPVILLIQDMAVTRWDSALFMMIIMINFGFIYILTAFLPLSAVMALIGLVLGRYSRKDCVVGGALVGLGFHLVFADMFGLEDGYIFASGVPIGAICGWIYWRIAIKRTPANGHAIEAA